LASKGNPDENREEAALLKAADEIVLDLTSILTLTFLDLVNYLPRRFKALVISQALVDEIAETLARDFSFPHPAMTVWKEDETYFRNEITPDNYARDRQSIERIRAFLQTQCTVVPVRTVLDVGKIKLEQMQDLLGKEAIAAILVAKERNVPFYSDDLGLRDIAKHEWQVSGFWTQTLLLDLRAKGLLSEDEYYNAVKKLLLAKYRFVSIDGAGLFWVLNEAGFTVTPAVRRVFESLHGPECSDESAVIVLSDVLKRLWLQSILYEQKLLLLDLVLNAITSGRDATSAIARLKIALKSQFALIPLVLRPIVQYIDVWLRRRNLTGGIIQL
jgi:predicted nucleic acid-binding protein